MRKYYISVPSFGSRYCSDSRYVIAINDDECIAGINEGHHLVIVVTKKGSYHETRGMMPQVLPLDLAYPDRPYAGYRRPLNVFNWKQGYSCKYASAEGGMGDVVLFARDSRATTPILARAKTVVTLDTASVPAVEDYEWSILPMEDMDPALTARESAIAAILQLS